VEGKVGGGSLAIAAALVIGAAYYAGKVQIKTEGKRGNVK